MFIVYFLGFPWDSIVHVALLYVIAMSCCTFLDIPCFRLVGVLQIRFGKKGKLSPRYIGPFKILECIGHIAYRLILPQELNSVHDVFHISNLKKCLAEDSVIILIKNFNSTNRLNLLKLQSKSWIERSNSLDEVVYR